MTSVNIAVEEENGQHIDERSTTTTREIPIETSTSSKQPTLLSYLKIYLFIYYEFTVIVLLAFSLGLLLPLHVMKMMETDARTFYLGLLTTISSVVTITAGIISGILSDKMTTIIGKRKPFLLMATIVIPASILGRCFLAVDDASTGVIVAYTLVFLCGSVALGCCMSVFRSFIVDIAHPTQMGIAGALLGLCVVVGIAVGSNVISLFFTLIPQYITVLIVLAMNIPAAIFILLFFKEPEQHYSTGLISFKRRKVNEYASDEMTALLRDRTGEYKKRNLSWGSVKDKLKKELVNNNPLCHWNFFWLFISRAFFQWSAFSYASFMIYFFYDSFHANYKIFIWDKLISNTVQASGVYGLISSLSSLASGIIFGLLRSNLGNKNVAFIGNASYLVGVLGLAIIRDYTAILFFAIFVGLGGGAYHSVDFVLITNAMPDRKNVARYIAVWQLSMSFPQLVSSSLSGVIITTCNKLFDAKIIASPHFGYVVLFLFSGCLQLASALAMALVKTNSTTQKKNAHKSLKVNS